MKTADNQFRKAQAQNERYFSAARRQRSKETLSPDDLVFVEETLTNQPHQSAPIDTGPFPVTVVNTHTVIIQRPVRSV